MYFIIGMPIRYMRLSESLRRNIMETIPGKILNKFKGRSSRSVVFFEDILAEYIKECEASGYDKELANLGYNWGLMGIQKLTSPIVRSFPINIQIN